MNRKNPIKSIFLFIGALIIFSACSQNLPEVRSGNCGLIAEYKTLDSYPKIKLSVFVQSESEIRRYESLNVKAVTSDYSWTVTDLIKNTENKKSFVGYNNFVMPDSVKFPTGAYNITVKTLDDEEDDLSLSLNYDTSIYKLKGSKVTEYIKNKSFRKKIAAYTEDGYLVFYGQLNGDNSTLERLANNYSEAVYYNEVYVGPGSTITFIMPQQTFERNKKD